MKQVFFAVILVAGMFLSACQKDAVVPQTQQTEVSTTKITTSTSNQNPVTPQVDTVKGYLRIQLAATGNSFDNILIDFDPTTKPTYSASWDAITFAGFGAVSLSSLTSNDYACAINTRPLTVSGTSVALKVGAKTDGTYKLNLLTVSAIPATFNIWLKDNFLKDSLDFRHNTTYAFNLKLADTNTYDSKRFSVVLRKGN